MKETNDITTYIMAKRVISSDLQKILSIYYRLTGLSVRQPSPGKNSTLKSNTARTSS